MISDTVAYFIRLGMWALIVAVAIGWPVWISWRSWERSLRHKGAEVRYGFACAHFVALAILPIGSAVWVHLSLNGMGPVISRGPPTQSPWGNGSFDHSTLALFVVGVWVLGFLRALRRLAVEATQLGHLELRPAPERLIRETQDLAERCLRKRRYDVAIADVSVPQVIGIRRSVLVAPMCLLDHPAAEREAVLLHELAHIVRRDFLTNLLQRLLLSALWFQPAAWAIYRRVVREREACCDRLAIRHGSSATTLVRALVRLAETGTSSPIAMTIGGTGDLSWRVNRLLEPTTIRPSRSVTASLCLVALAIGMPGLCVSKLQSADPVLSDLFIASAFGPMVAVGAHDPAGFFALRLRRGHVLGATVGNRRVPASGIIQKGDEVVLLGPTRRPGLSLRVTPAGRISWRARSASENR